MLERAIVPMLERASFGGVDTECDRSAFNRTPGGTVHAFIARKRDRLLASQHAGVTKWARRGTAGEILEIALLAARCDQR